MNDDKKNNLIENAYYLPLMDLNTYVIDNECVKNRSSKLELSAFDINYKVLNHEGIGIQNEDELDIYCSPRRKKIIEKRLLENREFESTGYKAYKNGLIKFHVSDINIESLIKKSYSDIAKLLNYYFVDGKCIKNRYGYTDEVSKEIADINVNNFSNIGIQSENKLKVYCDTNVERRIMNLIEHPSSKYLKKAYDKGNIKLYVE